MYKQYDFEKYLSDQYEIYKEYTQYYGDLLYNVENPEKNPFFSDENFRETIDDNKEQYKRCDMRMMMIRMIDDDNYDEDDNGKSSSQNQTGKIVIPQINYTLQIKVKKKTYKNIKIIECLNHNINTL